VDSALATGTRLSHYDPNHTPDYDRCAEYHERRRAKQSAGIEPRYKSREEYKTTSGFSIETPSQGQGGVDSRCRPRQKISWFLRPLSRFLPT